MNKIFHFLSIFSLLLFASASFSASDDISFSAGKKQDRGLVERVVSTDTIVLEGGERVKLIGLKAPAVPRRSKIDYDEKGFIVVPENENPITTVEEEAIDFVQSLLTGKYVRLEFDVQSRTDRFETLAYVYLEDGDIFVNAEILRQGFASLHLAAPNLKHAESLRAAYREARTEQRGLHNQ